MNVSTIIKGALTPVVRLEHWNAGSFILLKWYRYEECMIEPFTCIVLRKSNNYRSTMHDRAYTSKINEFVNF